MQTLYNPDRLILPPVRKHTSTVRACAGPGAAALEQAQPQLWDVLQKHWVWDECVFCFLTFSVLWGEGRGLGRKPGQCRMWAFRHCSPVHFSRNKLLQVPLPVRFWGHSTTDSTGAMGRTWCGVEALATLKLHADVFQPFKKF